MKNSEKGACGGALAGLIAGAKIGSGIGIALGPLGAIAGTIPCAVIGALVGGLTGDKIGTKFTIKSTIPRIAGCDYFIDNCGDIEEKEIIIPSGEKLCLCQGFYINPVTWEYEMLDEYLLEEL